MTRKLTALAALLALAATTETAEASPYVPVWQPPKKLTILPFQKYAVVYHAPLRKQCFRGPNAHLRARVFANRLRLAGAIVTMRCLPGPILIAPHPGHLHRACCVMYRMPRRVKVFHSLFAAKLFKAKMQSLGFFAYIKPLPVLRPLPIPGVYPQPYPMPIAY